MKNFPLQAFCIISVCLYFSFLSMNLTETTIESISIASMTDFSAKNFRFIPLAFEVLTFSHFWFLLMQIHEVRENVSVDAEPRTGYRDGAVLLLAGEWLGTMEPANITDATRTLESALAYPHKPSARVSEEK
jgi:hypothetical protein